MSLEVHFASKAAIVDWLRGGASLPRPLTVYEFGDSEFPTRDPEYSLANGQRAVEFYERSGYVQLFGDDFRIMAWSQGAHASLRFYPYEELPDTFVYHGENVLSFFDQHQALYGFAC